MADGTAVHGTGLRVVDGDIVVDDGRLALVDGPENLAQSLRLRVLTPLGSDRYHVRYGLDTIAIFTGPHGVREVRDLLVLNLVRTLGTDPRVHDVRDVTVVPVEGTDRRTWRAEVSIVDAAGGPAVLVLDVGTPA